MQDLLGRLEVPTERNRWDRPLFRVFAEGVQFAPLNKRMTLLSDECVDLNVLNAALFEKDNPRPMLSTKPVFLISAL